MLRRVVIGIVALLVVAGAAIAALVYWLLAGDGTRLTLERQATAFLGQPVHIETARAQVLPRIGIRLRNVRVGEPARVTLADVDVSASLRALLSRRLDEADIHIANSRIEMPLPFEIPTAREPATDASTPALEVVSIRSIALDKVVIASRGREISLSADSALTASRLAVSNLTASSRNTTIAAKGVVRLEPNVDAQLEVTADRLDLDDLMALADAFSPRDGARPSRAASPSGRIVARVSADSVTAAGLTVPQFFATVRVQGDRVSLSPMRFVLFGGRYEGDLDVGLREVASLALTSRVRDVDVAQLAAFGGTPDTITGKLSGNGSFSGRGADFSAMLASARGTGTVSIVNGTIRRLNLVRTVVLFFGKPAPETPSATDTFTRMDARFSLANQVLDAPALSLQSRDADIVAQGSLSLRTDALDGHADLSLSEELSTQAGADLYRYTREGNRIVLPATLRGTLDAPRLSIDAAAAIKRGLRNEVRERLKGLLDRFNPSPPADSASSPR